MSNIIHIHTTKQLINSNNSNSNINSLLTNYMYQTNNTMNNINLNDKM